MLLKGDFKVFKIKTVRNAVILAIFLIQTVPGLGLRSLQAESKREREYSFVLAPRKPPSARVSTPSEGKSRTNSNTLT